MLRIDLSAADAPECVLTPQGELRADAVEALHTTLHRHLRDRTEVLVDLGSMKVGAPSATHVFPAALAHAGGWPTARLVLFGADVATREVLRAERIPVAVPLAPDRIAARPLLTTRPERISRRTELPSDLAAGRRARAFVETACADWGVAGRFPDAPLVTTELVGNAVAHAATPSVLIASLDQHGLHIAVRDGSTDGVGAIRAGAQRPDAGSGLHLVAELARAWGVALHPDGKTMWAVLRR